MDPQATTINFGAPFAIFREDPDWMKKVAIVAVCILIPLVGAFQLVGYGHRCYAHARAGEKGLPNPVLGEDIGTGFFDWLKMLGNIFPVMILMWAVVFGCMFGGTMLGTLVAGAGGAAGGPDSGAAAAGGGIGAIIMMVSMLGGYLAIFVFAFFFGLLAIDMTRRIYNGETFPMFSPSGTIGAIKRAPMAFVMTWLLLMLSGMIGSLGIIVCYVGILATLPLATVLRALSLAEWDRVVKATTPDPVEAGY